MDDPILDINAVYRLIDETIDCPKTRYILTVSIGEHAEQEYERGYDDGEEFGRYITGDSIY